MIVCSKAAQIEASNVRYDISIKRRPIQYLKYRLLVQIKQTCSDIIRLHFDCYRFYIVIRSAQESNNGKTVNVRQAQ